MDEQIARWAATLSVTHPSTYKFASFVVGSYSIKAMPFVTLIVGLWFANEDGVRCKSAALTGLGGCFATLFICRLIQVLGPHRYRPAFVREFNFPYLGGLGKDSSSFPSDTAGFVFALVTAIFFASKRAGLAALVIAVLGPCLAKVVTGSHYVSDVIAGSIIGITTTIAVYTALGRYPEVLRLVKQASIARPGVFYALAFLTIFQLTTFFDDARKLGRGAMSVIEPQSSR